MLRLMERRAGLKRPCTGPYLEGIVKERHLHARHTVSFRNKAEAPFGLESFELEALDGLMAERKRRGHLLRRKLNLT